jgi:5-methylcytosine-specific restriction endonuclease McrA
MAVEEDPDRITAALASAAQALLAHDRRRADVALSEIAFVPGEVTRRVPVTVATTAAIFARDCFTCCYCGRRTIPSVVLRCFSAMWPEEFPYHPHGKTDEAHVAYWTIMSGLEHLRAGSRGGDWVSEENLACACWECNATKGTSAPTGQFANRAAPLEDWDGLTGAYPTLWEIAGRPQPSVHRPWLLAWSEHRI